MGHNIPGLKTFRLPSGESCNRTLGRMRKLTDRRSAEDLDNLDSQGRLPGGDTSQMNSGERQSSAFPREGEAVQGPRQEQ